MSGNGGDVWVRGWGGGGGELGRRGQWGGGSFAIPVLYLEQNFPKMSERSAEVLCGFFGAAVRVM